MTVGEGEISCRAEAATESANESSVAGPGINLEEVPELVGAVERARLRLGDKSVGAAEAERPDKVAGTSCGVEPVQI